MFFEGSDRPFGDGYTCKFSALSDFGVVGIAKFLTRLLQRSIQALERSTIQRIEMTTKPDMPKVFFSNLDIFGATLRACLRSFALAPLAPQFWGEPDSSPPELGDLGG
ncbi:hypothetical protein B9G53_18450 [Pseudanabaena sp. SR411]|uniref:hypothetical protein n=1 Tax=Pseudanabaena sp. SR411 TaxID=1980935 RepID=UPI000B98CD9B|nr:hypothetical protein [Pseudanabaena sp. SR411]OYQ63131.1 hypothetical protein B9G53_18450 [Pseudanabaena sp. SR411]